MVMKLDNFGWIVFEMIVFKHGKGIWVLEGGMDYSNHFTRSCGFGILLPKLF